VRLVELERQVFDAPRLGWHRDEDVASAMIPQFYFDYLRGGPVEPIAGIVRHNQMDLRGLAALFGKINAMLCETPCATDEVESLDLFGLSKFLQRRGDSERAHSTCAQALEAGLPAEFRPKARRDLAQMAKQRGAHEEAAGLWREIVTDPRDGVYACEQLAIYFERRAKDPDRALEFARMGLAQLRRQRGSSRDPYFAARCARTEEKFLQRMARLQQRMKSHADSGKSSLLTRSQSA
jgi:tetratricopeptide (TPR) repeat protein